jgi:CxC ATPase-based modification system component
MTLDPKLTEAIQSAVTDAGQSSALSRRLIAWMDAATSGNEDLNDADASARHLDLLYSETTVSVYER